MSTLSGKHFIAGRSTAEGQPAFAAENPATGQSLEPRFHEATAAEIDVALRAADEAFEELQAVDDERLAAMLDAVAAGLEAARDALVERAHAETGLPVGRLEGECARTATGVRTFAALVRNGSWVQARIDHGDPARRPVPKPDLRSLFIGVGPVVVFGASNFPLAISVAGTDTMAAFAARCPVIVKGHPAHPGTCELVGSILVEAIEQAGLPPGMFALLQAKQFDAGLALVRHPLTAAVAFTGSLRGGRALFDAAAARPAPIPVYAEMGSVNPLFLLPGALAEHGAAIAEGYVQSVNMGAGQFCTCPSMVLASEGPALDGFLARTKELVAVVPPAPMLHRGIHRAYVEGVERISAVPGMALAAESPRGSGPCEAQCRIFATAVEAFVRHEELSEEVFGPSSIVFRCDREEQMVDVARTLTGSLTATVHGTEQDFRDHADLLRILRRKVGRLIANGYPTGLEPCAALHHGGPYPATTHSGFTSVGTAAIYRFVRPLCYQNFPDSILPPQLREANPRGLHRLVDGDVRK